VLKAGGGRRSQTWLVVLLMLCPLAGIARGETRRVLVLSSAERPVAPQSGFSDALMRELIRSSREPIEFVEVPVQPLRASGEAPDVSIARRIRSTFGGDELDLVLTIGGPAATFAQQFRQDLFPATPTLIAGVDRRFVEHGTFTDNETTVATDHDPSLMIDEIERLLPETRSVTVVIGSSRLEQFWLREMQRQFRRFGDRLQFSYTNELSFDAIKERVQTMPPQSAIFFALLAVDGNGEPRVDGDTVKSLHAVANAPMFALFGMGDGVIGGPMMGTSELSKTTAQVALRLLAGESPGRIKTPIQTAGEPIYDERELRRWNIDEHRLPPASIVLFREPTTWERNRGPLAVGVLLGGIPVVAFVLFVGARRQRRAQGKLSNLSRHLIQEHERERAALAKTLHEDVGQRMVALTLRLHSLRGAEHDAEVADIRETLSGLAAEVAAASDAVYGRLELLGLPTVAKQLCEELSARHGVAIHFHERDVPRELPPDIALALFRVLHEATVNAAVHSQALEVWVSLRGAATEVRLQVVDRGVGFNAQRTVPGTGFGLVAIRERLKLVDGDSEIVSGPGEGTRVEAWVPLREPYRDVDGDSK
jgi:signal transduction histidine kinase